MSVYVQLPVDLPELHYSNCFFDSVPQDCPGFQRYHVHSEQKQNKILRLVCGIIDTTSNATPVWRDSFSNQQTAFTLISVEEAFLKS